MTLPFTHAQFLDLFGAYNTELGVAVVALWLISAAALVQYFRGRLGGRAVVWLLAVHWAWSGVVYHAGYFTRINPAAWLFAALFVVEAILLVWYGRTTLASSDVRLGRRWLADAFLVAAIVYPGLVVITGHHVPRAPLFAVPCPTVLFTAGLLLAMGPLLPRSLVVVPVLWAVVGGSAAITFHVVPDFLLFGAGLALIWSAVAPGTRTARLRPAA